MARWKVKKPSYVNTFYILTQFIRTPYDLKEYGEAPWEMYSMMNLSVAFPYTPSFKTMEAGEKFLEKILRARKEGLLLVKCLGIFSQFRYTFKGTNRHFCSLKRAIKAHRKYIKETTHKKIPQEGRVKIG